VCGPVVEGIDGRTADRMDVGHTVGTDTVEAVV